MAENKCNIEQCDINLAIAASKELLLDMMTNTNDEFRDAVTYIDTAQAGAEKKFGDPIRIAMEDLCKAQGLTGDVNIRKKISDDSQFRNLYREIIRQQLGGHYNTIIFGYVKLGRQPTYSTIADQIGKLKMQGILDEFFDKGNVTICEAMKHVYDACKIGDCRFPDVLSPWLTNEDRDEMDKIVTRDTKDTCKIVSYNVEYIQKDNKADLPPITGNCSGNVTLKITNMTQEYIEKRDKALADNTKIPDMDVIFEETIIWSTIDQGITRLTELHNKGVEKITSLVRDNLKKYLDIIDKQTKAAIAMKKKILQRVKTDYYDSNSNNYGKYAIAKRLFFEIMAPKDNWLVTEGEPGTFFRRTPVGMRQLRDAILGRDTLHDLWKVDGGTWFTMQDTANKCDEALITELQNLPLQQQPIDSYTIPTTDINILPQNWSDMSAEDRLQWAKNNINGSILNAIKNQHTGANKGAGCPGNLDPTVDPYVPGPLVATYLQCCSATIDTTIENYLSIDNAGNITIQYRFRPSDIWNTGSYSPLRKGGTCNAGSIWRTYEGFAQMLTDTILPACKKSIFHEFQQTQTDVEGDSPFGQLPDGSYVWPNKSSFTPREADKNPKPKKCTHYPATFSQITLEAWVITVIFFALLLTKVSDKKIEDIASELRNSLSVFSPEQYKATPLILCESPA